VSSGQCITVRQRNKTYPPKCPGTKGYLSADKGNGHEIQAALPQNGGLKPAPKPTTLDRMKLSVTVDRDEDGMWVVECPSIPGCVSQGKTKEDALKNIKEAIALCLEVRAERGLPLTVETRQVEVAV